MIDQRLTHILYRFPGDSLEAQDFFEALWELLSQDPAARLQSGAIALTPGYPTGALPETILALSHLPAPQVEFETLEEIEIQAGGLRLTSRPEDPSQPSAGPNETVQPGWPPGLPLETLARQLRGHILRLDHSGVELPQALVTRQQWLTLQAHLAATATLYRYSSAPGGAEADWRFLLPSRQPEFLGEISSFAAPRAPKFELTYPAGLHLPLLQFHLDSDLPVEVADRQLPSPNGFNLPGATTFRSVAIHSPWPAVHIRLDLSYANDPELSDWDSGAWLVKAGGRLH